MCTDELCTINVVNAASLDFISLKFLLLQIFRVCVWEWSGAWFVLLIGWFWVCFAERGDVWESYPTAPHVGACAEDSSLRAPAQRLSAPPARGRRRLQRRSEWVQSSATLKWALSPPLTTAAHFLFHSSYSCMCLEILQWKDSCKVNRPR